MRISSSVNRSRTRIKSLIALLILAVLGSSWAVLRADVPRVASGTWTTGGPFGDLPRDAASTVLPDGRLVVTGGSDSAGQPLAMIAFCEPASGAWSQAAMIEPRAGHTVTALANGRLLITGGRTSAGVTATTEIFDPATGAAVSAGALSQPRADHAAARLADGRVLIVGGSDGVSPMSLAEIFDPATGQSQGIGSVMSIARVRATATALLDGHVLIAGGNDGTNDLSTAEIFDPATGSFFNTGAMQTARSGHVAVLLPNNNQVLIAGGTSEGAAVASAELYADWRDGFSATTPMSAPRLGAIAGGLQSHDVAFVAGGGANTGDYYGYATVKTDKDDYWPGEPVTVSGSGWQPGEKVVLTISEDADTHYDFIYNAVADEAGNITNSEFAPIQNEIFQHFGKRFYVSARGAASRALNTFTDGNGTLTGTIRDSVTHAVIAGATITCSKVGANPCSQDEAATSTAIGSYSLTVNFPGQSDTVNITVSAPGYTSQTRTFTFSKSTLTFDWDLDPSGAASNLTVSSATGPYGGNTLTPLTATLTAGGNPVSGKLISFTLNGAPAGSATTDNSGVATLDSVSSLAGTNAGTYAAGVAASYQSQTVSSSLTVTPKAASVTPEAKSKTYGDADPALTGALSGFLAADGVTATYSRTAGQTVGTYTISATLAPAGVLNNYDITYKTASLEIAKKAASVTPNIAGKTYGDADPTLTGALSGFLDADGVTASYSRTLGETVGTYTISATLAPAGVLGNYAITYNTAEFTIAPKAASVTPNAAGKTYGDADPTLTGALSGFLDTDDVTASYTRTAGATVGTYIISATLAPAGVLGNYNVTYNTAEFTITPKAASVTPNAASKTYGDADPTLGGTLSGFLAADNVTATYTRTAGATVGTYIISATLAPAGVLGNYEITYNTASFDITKRAAWVTPNAASKVLGAADPVFTGTLDGFLTADGVTATYSRTAGETVAGNPYTISATLAPAGVLGNYAITYNTAKFTILYRWDGFLQPINDTAHDLGAMSKFKAGQTIPAKFVLKNATGGIVQQASNPEFSRSANLGACEAISTLEDPPAVQATVVPQFIWDGGQYHYNWSTKGLVSGLYRIFAKLADGTVQSVDICLTK